MTGLELSDRWWGRDDVSPPAQAKRAAVTAELAIEVGAGHELFRRIDRVEAFFEASDDVIVRLLDGTYALVHPTWSVKRESGQYPATIPLGGTEAASTVVAEWELNW